MIVFTTNGVESQRVIRVLDTVEGGIFKARHVGNDLVAGLSSAL